MGMNWLRPCWFIRTSSVRMHTWRKDKGSVHVSRCAGTSNNENPYLIRGKVLSFHELKPSVDRSRSLSHQQVYHAIYPFRQHPRAGRGSIQQHSILPGQQLYWLGFGDTNNVQIRAVQYQVPKPTYTMGANNVNNVQVGGVNMGT